LRRLAESERRKKMPRRVMASDTPDPFQTSI
jgi:hypothetical protein